MEDLNQVFRMYKGNHQNSSPVEVIFKPVQSNSVNQSAPRESGKISTYNFVVKSPSEVSRESVIKKMPEIIDNLFGSLYDRVDGENDKSMKLSHFGLFESLRGLIKNARTQVERRHYDNVENINVEWGELMSHLLSHLKMVFLGEPQSNREDFELIIENDFLENGDEQMSYSNNTEEPIDIFEEDLFDDFQNSRPNWTYYSLMKFYNEKLLIILHFFTKGTPLQRKRLQSEQNTGRYPYSKKKLFEEDNKYDKDWDDICGGYVFDDEDSELDFFDFFMLIFSLILVFLDEKFGGIYEHMIDSHGVQLLRYFKKGLSFAILHSLESLNKFQNVVLNRATNGLVNNKTFSCYERAFLIVAAIKVLSLHKYCFDYLQIKIEGNIRILGEERIVKVIVTEAKRQVVQQTYDFLTKLLGGESFKVDTQTKKVVNRLELYPCLHHRVSNSSSFGCCAFESSQEI